MEQIIDVFEVEGMTLKEQEKQKKYFVLKRKKAITYTLDNGEDLSFYIFGSEKKRKRGLKDFNRQKAQYDMQVPAIYEVNNVLVFYWYKGETGSKTQYGDRIQKVVNQLEQAAGQHITKADS